MTLKIAVIDSGIDRAFINQYPDIVEKQIHLCNGEYTETDNAAVDEFGHGTQVISYLHHLIPSAHFYSVKALDENGYTSTRQLASALERLCSEDVSIIHLSLSVIRLDSYAFLIMKYCRFLQKQGKIIICSVQNGCRHSFPASLPNILGVRGAVFAEKNDVFYYKHSKICLSDALPVLVYSCGGALDYFSGNSKAACIVTAKVAQAIAETHPIVTFKAVANSLAHCSKRPFSSLKRFERITQLYHCKDPDIYSFDLSSAQYTACRLWSCSIAELQSKPLLQLVPGLEWSKLDALLKAIESNSGIRIKRFGLCAHDVIWAANLWNYIENHCEERNEQN